MGGVPPAFRNWRHAGSMPLDCLPKPCSACGRAFQPTVRRRMLCGPCFSAGAPTVSEHTHWLERSPRKIAARARGS